MLNIRNKILSQFNLTSFNNKFSEYYILNITKCVPDRILPDTSYGRLEQMTEVIIENTSRSRPLRSSPDSISHPQNCVLKTTENASLWDLLSDFIPFHRPNTEDHAENVVKTPLLLSRVHPLAHSVERVGCTDLPHDPQEHPYNVFVTMDTLLRHSRMRNNTSLQNLLKNKSAIVCQMENVPLKLSKPVKGKVQVDEKTKNNTLDESRKPVGVFVRLYTLEDFCECFGTKRTKIPCVYASQFLMKVLNVKVCDKVQLTVFRPSLNKMLTSIALVPSRELVSDFCLFKSRLGNHIILVTGQCHNQSIQISKLEHFYRIYFGQVASLGSCFN